MVYKPKPTPFLSSFSSVRWKLHSKPLQPRTQDSFSLQLPVRGLFHWEKQDLSISHLSPSILMLKASTLSAAKRWRLPSSTQHSFMGQRLYLGNDTAENSGVPGMSALACTAWFHAKRDKLKRPGEVGLPSTKHTQGRFCLGEEVSQRTESSQTLPKWTDFICNRVWRNLSLRVLSKQWKL